MPINQLPPEIAAQLRQYGSCFVCTMFRSEFIGPPIVQIGSRIYYRFMDYIYLPCPPEDLTPEQVIEVCDLRLDHLSELVNLRLNKAVVAAMSDLVVKQFPPDYGQLEALDFGCGSGLSSRLLVQHLPMLRMVGVDISEKAVFQCRKEGLDVVYSPPGGRLPFRSSQFDVIFAVFVMHFNVNDLSLREICRVLRRNGVFLFNIYHRDVSQLLERLKTAGLDSSTVIHELPRMPKNHYIVSASKLSTMR